MLTRFAAVGCVGLVIFFAAAIRLRLLDMPLERDEGEFAYMGQLILQGIPPYLTAYTIKFPGTSLAYALIMAVCGESAGGIHVGLLVVNAATIVAVFFFTKYVVDTYAGVIASAAFALLSLSPSVYGTSAHATHFVILCAIGGIYLVLRAIDEDHARCAIGGGVLLALGVLMKQNGAFFLVFAGLLLLLRGRATPYSLARRGTLVALYVLGGSLPLLVTAAALYGAGAFERFWFWVFSYASQYVSQVSPAEGWELFRTQVPRVIGKEGLLWALALFGLGSLAWDARMRSRAGFVLGFSIFSFLAVCPGMLFREHYFVLLLPALALLIGGGMSSLRGAVLRVSPRLKVAPTILFLAALGCGVAGYRAVFFDFTPEEACRAMYGVSPFPESLKIAEYIDAHADRDATIVVLGSEPQIYFYARRRSATGYLYTYPLMERQQFALVMQKEMAAEIERSAPQFVVVVNVETSWLARPDSKKYFFKWTNRYIQEHFARVGVVDILSELQTVYRWGDEVQAYTPRSSCHISVYEKKHDF